MALYDPNAERLAFIAGVAQRMMDAASSTIRVTPSNDLERALAGAQFVIPQIRVGGLAARKRDETLPMELGLVGNETIGAGGFVCALRTVPVVVDIARVVERVAPDASSPQPDQPGRHRHRGAAQPHVRAHAGVLQHPHQHRRGDRPHRRRRLGRIRLDSFGLNHLSWLRAAYVDGEDVLGPLIDEASAVDAPVAGPTTLMDVEDFRALRLLPSWYTRYFYFTEAVVAADRTATETKADSDTRAEERLGHLMATVGYDDEVRDILASKGGASYYVNVLQAINSIVHDTGAVIVADVRNGGAIAVPRQ